MGSNWARVTAITMAASAILACSGTTEPHHTDVVRARSAWLASHPRAYRFDVMTQGSWFPSLGFYHVQVSNGQVVAATDPSGNAVGNVTLTIDTIWVHLLAAREKGELNSAEFNERGVPVESDMGPWAVDGGMHYSVRNFVEGE